VVGRGRVPFPTKRYNNMKLSSASILFGLDAHFRWMNKIF
jgi:hypothetical protein